MRSVNVPLPEPVIEKLAALARREYRDPRRQAAVLLVDAIERAERGPASRQEPADLAASAR